MNLAWQLHRPTAPRGRPIAPSNRPTAPRDDIICYSDSKERIIQEILLCVKTSQKLNQVCVGFLINFNLEISLECTISLPMCYWRNALKKLFICYDICFFIVHGEWGSWGNYSECSITCGFGFKIRKRNCDSPPPQYGGNKCSGAIGADYIYGCNRYPCPS